MEKRNTIQKQLVLDAVAALANHPTADAVYDVIAKTHPTVSKATVYRNLGSLSEDGRLRHIRMPGGADRFDHCLTDHCHIECTRCGALADAPIVHETTLDSTVASETGFTNVSHDTVYHGICPQCSKKLA
ncbi:MAG: transcriptional repressor [Ruthenibacterium sp.]